MIHFLRPAVRPLPHILELCIILRPLIPLGASNTHQKLQTMLGLSAIRHSIARSGGAASNCNFSAAIRALSTTESLKVGSAATTPPPSATTKEENIKYFKIYRWDPDHQQKPVSIYN